MRWGWIGCTTVVLVGFADAKAESQGAERTITVTASDRVDAEPDLARIRMSIVTSGKLIADAMAESEAEANRLFKALVRLGVRQDDFSVGQVSVRAPSSNRSSVVGLPQEFVAQRGQQIPQQVIQQLTRASSQFSCSRYVNVTVRDLAKVGELMDRVVDVGFDPSMVSVSYIVNDARKREDDAGRRAMAEARRKAKIYAEAAEVSLGPVVRVDVVDETTTRSTPSAANFSRTRARNSRDVSIARSTTTQHSVKVKVTFAIK